MKSIKSIPLLLSVGALVFAVGCNMVDSPEPSLSQSSVVLREQFCVQFDENRTTGQFEKEVVCDQFAMDIKDWLDENNITGKDIHKIFMSGARILEGDRMEGSHRWDITSSVYIKRSDVDDGPERFLRSQTITLPDDIEGKGYKPHLDQKGVKLVNRALEDFVDAKLPVLVVKMINTDVDPEPSEEDPLIFSWQACIEVQVILRRGNGGHGDDDSSSDDHDSGSSDDHDSGSSDDHDSGSSDD